MKVEEKVTAKVYPEYYTEKDQDYVQKYGVNVEKPLLWEIEMKRLVKVEDVYRDGTSFQKTITKGTGSASPYSDFLVLSKSFVKH